MSIKIVRFEFVLKISSSPTNQLFAFRTSQTVRKRLSQTNLFSLFSSGLGRNGKSSSRVEYVRLVGANELGGHAEMAIAKSKEYRGGCETPSSEPGLDLLDLWDLEDDDASDQIYNDPGGQNHLQGGPQVLTNTRQNSNFDMYLKETSKYRFNHV